MEENIDVWVRLSSQIDKQIQRVKISRNAIVYDLIEAIVIKYPRIFQASGDIESLTIAGEILDNYTQLGTLNIDRSTIVVINEKEQGNLKEKLYTLKRKFEQLEEEVNKSKSNLERNPVDSSLQLEGLFPPLLLNKSESNQERDPVDSYPQLESQSSPSHPQPILPISYPSGIATSATLTDKPTTKLTTETSSATTPPLNPLPLEPVLLATIVDLPEGWRVLYQQLMDFFKTQPETEYKVSDIAKKFKVKEVQARKALNVLTGHGWLTKRGKSPAKYSITETGKSANYSQSL